MFVSKPTVGKLSLKRTEGKYFRFWEPRDKNKDITFILNIIYNITT